MELRNKFEIGQKLYTVIRKPIQNIKYKVDCQSNYEIKSRPETQLFTELEEAEKFCYDNNNPLEKVEE